MSDFEVYDIDEVNELLNRAKEKYFARGLFIGLFGGFLTYAVLEVFV